MQSDSEKRVLVRLAAGAALGAALLTVLMPVDFLLAWGRWPGVSLDVMTVSLGAGIGAVVAVARLRAGYAAVVGFVVIAVPLVCRGWIALTLYRERMMPTMIGFYALAGAAAAVLCAVLLPRLLPEGKPPTTPTAKRPAR
jgi:hypothetical protein